MNLICEKPFKYAGERLKKGDPFTARRGDAKILIRVKLASEDKTVRQELGIAPSVAPPVESEVEPFVVERTSEVTQVVKAPAKRPYTKRDPSAPKRTYTRRNLTAE